MTPTSRDRPRLAIAWPTYNRSRAIAQHLDTILAEANLLGVPLYISDDSSDTATELAVVAAASPIVHYRRNVPALRHDANLIATLGWPDADYVWLIRDKMHPVPRMLERIIDFLGEQDLVFVNSHSDDYRMIPAVSGDAARALTRDALWHQTLTGATIYSRRVCKCAAQVRVWPNFPQLSLILDQASIDPITVGWFGQRSLITLENSDDSYWNSKAIDVFVRDWAAVIVAFPEVVPVEQRAHVIGTHSTRTDLFNARTLLELKANGQFTYASLRLPWFQEAMQLPRWKLLVLLIMPQWLLPRSLFKWIRTIKARRQLGGGGGHGGRMA